MKPLLLLLALLLPLQAALPSPTDAAKERLETAINEVMAVASRSSGDRELAEDLRPVLLKYISFDVLTRRAVGPGWSKFTEAQKQEVVRMFTTLTIRTYSSKITPGERPVIEIKNATNPAPGRVEINTSVLYQGKRTAVVYRMEEAEGWRITDIVIEGVSMILNYRTQFDAQFKKGGANAVLRALTQTLNKPQ